MTLRWPNVILGLFRLNPRRNRFVHTMALYNAEQLIPPPKAMYKITTAQTPVRGEHGADIVAQHGLCVDLPLMRPISPSIKVWETAEGVWWQDILARAVSKRNYSVNCFALQHDTLALATHRTQPTLEWPLPNRCCHGHGDSWKVLENVLLLHPSYTGHLSINSFALPI